MNASRTYGRAWLRHAAHLLRVHAMLARAARTLATSYWARPIGRVLLIGSGLVLLAFVGQSSLARSSAIAPAAAAVATADPLSLPAGSGADADAGTQATTGPPAHRRASPEQPVFINEATLEELERLPGVGPKRAKAIFDLRARLGRFRRVEDLLRVKGIGKATLRKIRPVVRFEVATAPLHDAGAPSPAR